MSLTCYCRVLAIGYRLISSDLLGIGYYLLPVVWGFLIYWSSPKAEAFRTLAVSPARGFLSPAVTCACARRGFSELLSPVYDVRDRGRPMSLPTGS